jgi:hypothetical protein
MAEIITSSLEDYLIDGLSFKLSKTASYVTNRRSVTYHPQGSNIYSTTGTKLIKFHISGSDWLDPSTFRVMFDLVNTDARADRKLRPIGGPWSFFQRMRILCGGVVLEDLDMYHRTHEMFSIFTSQGSRENDLSQGFCNSWGSSYDVDTTSVTPLHIGGIPPSQSMSVLFKPLSGILRQPKFLPIRYMPLTIELTLVDDSTLPIISGTTSNTAIMDGTVDMGNFLAANTSYTWSIQNAMVKCDLITLDSGLNESYAKVLEEGKKLTINYNTFISQIQSIVGQTNIQVSLTRSLTRLKAVYVSLLKGYAAGSGGRERMVASKPWNDFFSPMSPDVDDGTLYYNQQGEFETQLAIGSKIFPEYPLRGHREAFYQLQKTLGMRSNAMHSFDISGPDYHETKFVIGIDCEKVIEAGFTGLNTRSTGDLMVVRFKYAPEVISGTATNANYRIADQMHIVMHADHILEIHDVGVRVFD